MRKLNRCVREFPTRQLAASIDVSVSARIPLGVMLRKAITRGEQWYRD